MVGLIQEAQYQPEVGAVVHLKLEELDTPTMLAQLMAAGLAGTASTLLSREPMLPMQVVEEAVVIIMWQEVV